MSPHHRATLWRRRKVPLPHGFVANNRAHIALCETENMRSGTGRCACWRLAPLAHRVLVARSGRCWLLRELEFADVDVSGVPGWGFGWNKRK